MNYLCDVMYKIWNERYATHNNIYGKEPNQFFKQELDKLSPGNLLLPGEGEGRNAIYAERKGWEVTAFDSSEVAIENAMRNAKEAGYIFDYVLADTSSFEALDNSFDAIAMIFFHLSPFNREAFHKRIIAWLKPGGTLIIEAFNPTQLDRTSGGPKDISMLYTEDMLRKDFSSLNIELLLTTTEELNEGSFHQGTAELIRLVARK